MKLKVHCSILEGGLAAAAVLISFGAVIGEKELLLYN